MYNRYIPQSDGTYQKKRMQEAVPNPPNVQKPPTSAPVPCPPPEPVRCPPPPPRPKPRPYREPEHTSITTFLKQLLPAGLDTGDLLVVLLLLLMSGDCQEDPNTALLTLVLYLFL